MFTGIIEETGRVASIRTGEEGARLEILAPTVGAGSRAGDSVAVNGVCLTVVALEPGAFATDVGPETARITTLGSLAPGCLVNLERPLRADGRFGGHFVQGHVDATGRIEELRSEAEFHWLTVSYPLSLSPLFVHKGSVAVDGISLTVADLRSDCFVVQLVPYTMEHTNLSRARVHDSVNLECDMVGKYVARAAELAGLKAGSV